MAETTKKRRESWDRALGPDGKRTKIPEATARRVWIAAGGRCTFCGKNLVWDEVTGKQVLVGQLAHIVGATEATGSPRGRFPLDLRRRHEAENLMLLCYDQHHVIDNESIWDLYSVDRLRELKREHEDRMRQMTSMTIARSTTVLRLVGRVGDVAIDLSDDAVEAALLERNYFPDYKLRGIGALFEIDVRNHADYESDTYWQSAAAAVREKGHELRRSMDAHTVSRVSVLALARIPLLVELGNVIGEASRVELYPHRKSGTGGFGWSEETAHVTFKTTELQRGTSPAKVAVLVSATGRVDRGRLPATFDSEWTLLEIEPANGAVGPGLDRSQATIESFRDTWAKLLASLESVPGLESVALFAAAPATLAITLGRCLIRGRSPSLLVFDLFEDGEYHPTLEVAR